MMQSLSGLAVALLQDDGVVRHDLHLMVIFMGIIMAGVLIGFIGLSIAGVFALRLMYRLQEMAERLEGKISPMVDKTRVLVEELGPKVHTITTNVEQISYTVRSKVDEFGATADEINRTVKDANKRTQAHVARVDGMVNDALHSAQNVQRAVQEGVRKPVHQIAGIIAGIKKGVETWVDRSPFKRNVYVVEEDFRVYETPPPPPRYTTPNAPGAERPAAPERTSAEERTGSATSTSASTTAGETKRMTPYG
jgi:hypothetical protein